MDGESFDVICWGSHSLDGKRKPPRGIWSRVQQVALTNDRLWLHLKDGHLQNGLAGAKPGKIASDVVDVFTGAKQIITADKDGQISEWPAYRNREESENKPVPIPLPNKRFVVQAACGKSHMVILTKYCEVYTKGSNSLGQLGLGEKVSTAAKPKILSYFKHMPVSQIATGAYSSFCVSISGRVFAWGQNEYGQLGFDSIKAKKIWTPKFLRFSSKNAVAHISAGDQHTALLTKAGELFMCGSNSRGQIGSRDTSRNYRTPWRVQELKDSSVTQVACGQTHTIAYAPGCGQVFGFGSNSEGQLGNHKDKNFISEPAMLNGPWCDDKNTKVHKVLAGGNCTLILYVTSCGEVPEADYRVIPQRHHVAKINKDLCEKTTGLEEDSENFEEALKELELLFGSASCINASFCSTDNKPMNEEFLGIDFTMADKITKRLGLRIHPKLSDKIGTSIQRVILQDLPNTKSSDVETLKVYIILPVVIKALFQGCYQKNIFLSLMDKTWKMHERMEPLLRLVNHRDYLSLLIELCKDVLGDLRTPPNDTQLLNPVRMLEMLFKINVEKEFFHYKKFYVPNIPEEVLEEHYVSWKVSKTRQWNICEFPFLLDAKAKAALLQIHTKKRLRTVRRVKPLILKLNCEDLMESAYELDEIADIQLPLLVEIVGQTGYDDRAYIKEYFRLMFEELLSKNLFVEDEISNLLWFPKDNRDNEEETLKLLTIVGKLLGMALYNGAIVSFNMPLALYKELKGEKLTLADFIEINPSVGKSFKEILDFVEEGETVEEKFGPLPFTLADGTPLKDGGEDIIVTTDNRQEFVSLYLDYFFHKTVQRKLGAFTKGFFRAFPQDMLKLFRSEELLEITTGIENYDWETLKDSTSYVGIFNFNNEHHYIIEWFWDVLLSMKKDEKNKFLIFITGSDKIPITGLQLKITLVQECDDFLPQVRACDSLLFLNIYSSKNILKEKLLEAICCKGFHA